MVSVAQGEKGTSSVRRGFATLARARVQGPDAGRARHVLFRMALRARAGSALRELFEALEAADADGRAGFAGAP